MKKKSKKKFQETQEIIKKYIKSQNYIINSSKGILLNKKDVEEIAEAISRK